MHHVTDIPDWNEWQGLNIPPLLGKPPSAEQILELRKRSPIAYAHKVKTPTLMNIGLKVQNLHEFSFNPASGSPSSAASR
jgi:hypothetical protein